MAERTICFVLCLLIGLKLTDAIDLEPLTPVSCPNNNSTTHTCYYMTRYNTTCANITVSSCSPGDTEVSDSSSEDWDDDNSRSVKDSVRGLYEYRHHWSHPWIKDVCIDVVSGTCTVYQCNKKCCDGWLKDNTGRCDKPADPDSIHCENGGTFVSWNNRCNCATNFTGKRCETAICPGGCYNDGHCEHTMDGNLCNCPPPTFGPNCLQVSCPKCENGGTCVVDGRKAICLCKPGYFGDTCNYVQTESRCPAPNNTVCTDLRCSHKCHSSKDCSRDTICCTDGCCNTCVKPQPKACTVNGKDYGPGDTFMKDTCRYCMCLVNGTVTCSTIVCPDITCTIGKPVYKVGTCCPVCEDISHIPPGYSPPTFRRCPHNGLLEVTVPANAAIADMHDLNLKALDHYWIGLKVEYSPEKVRHCKCLLTSRDAIPVTAFATDSYGQRSECRFRTLVKDRTPPYFVTCPADIYALESETIRWVDPIVYDNVGVRSTFANHLSLDYFSVGNNTVTYTAYDYDNNQAICQFTVFVYAYNTDASRMPEGLTSRSVQHSSLNIIVGCVSAVVFILLMVLMGCFIRRFRQRPPVPCQRPRRNIPVNTVSNAVYERSLGLFPDFKGASVKLPPYSPPSNPPVYQELDAAHASEYVYEDPPHYEDVTSTSNPVSDTSAYEEMDCGRTQTMRGPVPETNAHSDRVADSAGTASSQSQRPPGVVTKDRNERRESVI